MNKKQTFYLMFSSDPDILNAPESSELEVISEPILYYSKWYHKILHYISFKTRFIEGYKYNVKTVIK